MLLIGFSYFNNETFPEGDSLLLNAYGRPMGKIIINEEISNSCATVLNGEAVLFSEYSESWSVDNIVSQVSQVSQVDSQVGQVCFRENPEASFLFEKFMLFYPLPS